MLDCVLIRHWHTLLASGTVSYCFGLLAVCYFNYTLFIIIIYYYFFILKIYNNKIVFLLTMFMLT